MSLSAVNSSLLLSIISNILSFVQQIFTSFVYSPKKVIAQQMVEETILRRSKENTTKLRVENEKK